VAAAQSAHDAVAAEVARIEQRVRDAEGELQRMTVESEAASDAVLVARSALSAAQAEAAVTAAALAAARAAVEQTQADVAALGREAYMRQDSYGHLGALLDAGSPGELLQQAATLELLGADRAARLEQLEVAEAEHDRADRAAQAAVAERDRIAQVAAEAEAAANEQLASAQVTYDAAAAEKAALDEQLRGAEVELLRLQGARDAQAEWDRRQAAEQAAQAVSQLSVTAGAIAPTNGRVSSCYGSRWGTMHYGVDIAAPIGTPVYAPEAGVVLQAGPASGFGLAVYVQHAGGSITVYGHVNQFFVTPGQTVTAGQQIAEVGNRGQSTGPHLHFEVHDGGLYADRADPVPWLRDRGVSLGGSCG
jgi:murein DD-endopeptidase MepM/ murein hydrolase activator NlpD